MELCLHEKSSQIYKCLSWKNDENLVVPTTDFLFLGVICLVICEHVK